MDHYIVYKGRQIAFAAMQKGYLPALMPWINDPKATAGVLTTPPIMLEAEEEWIARLAKGSASDVVFAILAREDEGWRYIGHTGLHKITWPAATASSGTFIGDTSTHQKGYGTEAKLWLLYHAFRVLGLRKVTSEVKDFNGNSFGHLLRCGYGVVGVRKKQHFYDGAYVDEIVFEIFREDFEPRWKDYQETGELPKLTDEQRALIQKYSGEK